MPSYSIALLVSFLAFICGQLFDALCMSFQPTGMELENFLVTGISFRTTLVAIVLRALPILVVHGTILLLRRHLCSSVKHELDDTFKTVAAAASVPARNDCEPSLAALASAEVIPLLKKSTALSASTDKVAFPSPSSLLASGPDPQDSTAFVALNETAISTCRLNVKEEVDTDTEHILSHSLRIGECIQASPDQDDSVHARHSQVPLLLLVAAAAQLRRLRAKAFDESCDAKIVEVVESAEEFEKIDDAENSSEEVAGETMQTLVVEANSTDDAKIIEDVPGDHAFGVPLIEELDGVPTYEEFVQDAPLEPLFEKKAFAPLVHVIHRPPPLSLLAVRASVKPRSEHIPPAPPSRPSLLSPDYPL
ncbi:hypothetical protein MSAN_02342800 [Mycena sanguinolenta]|uniref:Membrane-associated protein n=1 Tax=Mycena sanguinolenta TaxID=230812 RepID=A0A8H7CFE9_9AGAR|nr:hypothetical protein MSAN_02342800 [Mycena sanguinolenta]